MDGWMDRPTLLTLYFVFVVFFYQLDSNSNWREWVDFYFIFWQFFSIFFYFFFFLLLNQRNFFFSLIVYKWWTYIQYYCYCCFHCFCIAAYIVALNAHKFYGKNLCIYIDIHTHTHIYICNTNTDANKCI